MLFSHSWTSLVCFVYGMKINEFIKNRFRDEELFQAQVLIKKVMMMTIKKSLRWLQSRVPLWKKWKNHKSKTKTTSFKSLSMNRRYKTNGSHLLLQHNLRNDFLNEKLQKETKSITYRSSIQCTPFVNVSIGIRWEKNTKIQNEKKEQTNRNYQSDAIRCDVMLPEL